MYDVIICGSGPAGMSAALALKQANLDIMVIEKDAPGGKLNIASKVENYPGYLESYGVDLAIKMYKQTKNLHIPYKFEEVIKLEKINDEHFIVKTNENSYEGKRVIWAAGSIARLLNVKNEKEFLGKGISYCAICDGIFYANKDVVVIGSGNSAFGSALYLSRICNKVTIIARHNKLHASEQLINKARHNKKITIIENQEIVSFDGDELLENVVIRNAITGEVQTIPTHGAYIYIGFIPSSAALEEYDILNPDKYIIVDQNCETKIKGLYAAGDCIQKEIRQIATAVYEGIICAASIIKNI